MHRCYAAPDSASHPRVFTLLELLVTMGIISLLAVMLLPALSMSRGHARDTKCKSNLTQIWKSVNIYANNHNDMFFSNLDTPTRISNVAYSNGRPTGLGCLYPMSLIEPRILYCPSDPVRSQEWTYGWANWGTPDGEVQISYGYRGGQGFFDDPNKPVTVALVDTHPQKVFIAEFYEPFTSPARVHHATHINFLRCNGQVEAMNLIPSFGPNDDDFIAALNLLDK